MAFAANSKFFLGFCTSILDFRNYFSDINTETNAKVRVCRMTCLVFSIESLVYYSRPLHKLSDAYCLLCLAILTVHGDLIAKITQGQMFIMVTSLWYRNICSLPRYSAKFVNYHDAPQTNCCLVFTAKNCEIFHTRWQIANLLGFSHSDL
jgi:hypothetical protein